MSIKVQRSAIKEYEVTLGHRPEDHNHVVGIEWEDTTHSFITYAEADRFAWEKLESTHSAANIKTISETRTYFKD